MARQIPANEIHSNNSLSMNGLIESEISLFSGFSTNCLPQWLHLNLGLPLWILPFLTILSERHFGPIIFFFQFNK